MVFYGDRKRGYAKKQLQENWRLQKAVIFVLMERITLGSEKILDNARRFLHIQNTERDKLCFRKFYLRNLGLTNRWAMK